MFFVHVLGSGGLASYMAHSTYSLGVDKEA